MLRHALSVATRPSIAAIAGRSTTIPRVGNVIRAASSRSSLIGSAKLAAPSPAPSLSSLHAAARSFSTSVPRRSPYFSPPPPPADEGSDNPHYEREMTRDAPPAGRRYNVLLWAIIGINGVVLYWWTQAKSPADVQWMQDNFVCDLRNVQAGRYHTLVSSAFSHQSLMHFGANMMSMYFIAPAIMVALGPRRTAALFLAGAISGSVAHIAWSNYVRPRMHKPPTKAMRVIHGRIVIVQTYDTGAVGASGGITTLAVLLACLWPRTPLNLMLIPIPIPARLLVGGFILFDLVASLELGGSKLQIGHWGHLGGAALGALYYAAKLRGRPWMPRPDVDPRGFYWRMAARRNMLKQRQEWLSPGLAQTGSNANQPPLPFTPPPPPPPPPSSPLIPGSSLLPGQPPMPPPPPRTTPRSLKYKKLPPRQFSTLAASCRMRMQRRAFSTAAVPLPSSFQQLCVSAPTTAAAMPTLALSSRPMFDVASLSPSSVLVRVSHASINPSDAKNALGLFVGITTWPRVPGRDFCGEVVAAGSAAAAQAMIGQTVFGSGGELGFMRDGTHAQFLVLDASDVVVKPRALSSQAAASVGVTYCTAASGLKRARLSSSDLVLVTGASGGVGGAVVQLAKRAGAKVIAVVRTKASVVPLADAHIYLSDLAHGFADLPAAVQALQITRDHHAAACSAAAASASASPYAPRLGASLIFDVLGGSAVAPLLSSLSTRGRLVCIAMPLGVRELTVHGLELYREELEIIGANSLHISTRQCAHMMRDMQTGFESGQLQPPATTLCAPSAIGQAYADVLSGKAKGKLVIQWKD